MRPSPLRPELLPLLAGLLLQGCGADATVPAGTANPIRVSSADAVALEPHALTDGERVFATWIRAPEAGEASADLMLSCVGEGSAVVAEAVAAADREWIAEPRLAWLEQPNRLYLVWEEGRLDGGERRLVGRTAHFGGDAFELGAIETIDATGGLFPRPASTGADTLELVYVRTAPGRHDLDLAHRARTNGSWSEARALLSTPDDEWLSDVVADPAGRLHVAFDTYHDRRFGVRYAVVEHGLPGEVRSFETGAGYQGYPTLALEPPAVFDRSQAVWIAWEEADRFGELGGLRERRSLALFRVAEDEVRRVPPEAYADRLGGLRCDFPKVAVTDDGLVVTTRGLAPPFDDAARAAEDLAARAPVARERLYRDPKSRFYTAFWTRAITFDAEQGLPEVVELPATEGDNDAAGSLLALSSGALAVTTTDARATVRPTPGRFDDAIEGRWRVELVGLPATHGFPPLVRFEAGAPPPLSPSAVEDVVAARPGERSVFFGDLHRHTHVSRCAGSSDGTLLDTYRYARGPGRLDFLAVTDHFQHTTPWAWWRNLREVARFHAPGRLVAFAAIERASKDRAHRNDVYRRSGALPYDPEAWNDFPENGERRATDVGERISIPHMMGRRESPWRWNYFRPDTHRLLEIYQGARGSYEGPGLPYQASDLDVPRARVEVGLRLGHQFGFVAASDHGSSSAGLTGVYADELTREAVFDALFARDCFAATDFARVDVALGELGPGAEGSSRTGDRLRVYARGLAPVAAIETVVAAPESSDVSDVPYEVGEGDEELFVLTSRRWGPYPDRPMRLAGVDGARIVSARVRRRGPHEAKIEQADGVVTFSKLREPLDLVLAISGAREGALELSVGEESTRVQLDGLVHGRSLSLPVPVDREQLLRIGAPLGPVALQRDVALALPAGGAAVYVRVLFEDGNVAWSSPIHVTEVAER